MNDFLTFIVVLFCIVAVVATVALVIIGMNRVWVHHDEWRKDLEQKRKWARNDREVERKEWLRTQAVGRERDW